MLFDTERYRYTSSLKDEWSNTFKIYTGKSVTQNVHKAVAAACVSLKKEKYTSKAVFLIENYFLEEAMLWVENSRNQTNQFSQHIKMENYVQVQDPNPKNYSRAKTLS